MSVSMIAVLLLVVSFVFLPWSITAALSLAAGLIDPLLLIASGVTADVLYYTQGPSWPFFTLLALAIAPFLYVVRRSVKTSIITE